MSGETVPTSWRAWDFLVREAQKVRAKSTGSGSNAGSPEEDRNAPATCSGNFGTPTQSLWTSGANG
jgi:hypothetical protein